MFKRLKAFKGFRFLRVLSGAADGKEVAKSQVVAISTPNQDEETVGPAKKRD